MTTILLRPPPKLEFKEIPEEMRSRRRWVTWNPVDRNGKITKRPVQNIADESTWLSFDEAYQRVVDGETHGPGYVLGDGMVGIDLDRCIDAKGTLHPIAQEALALGSYAERSPSRRGIHVFIRGTIARSRNIRPSDGIPGHEIYDGSRFFCVSGDRISTSNEIASGPKAQASLDSFISKWFPEPPPVIVTTPTVVPAPESPSANDKRVLQLLFGSKNGTKAKRLFSGDSSDYLSTSEGDYAFIRQLRFYTQDPEQIERIFRASDRMRDKVVAHPTYLRETIKNALRAGGKVYRPESDAARVARLLERQVKAKASIPLWMAAYLSKVGAIPVLVLLVIAAYADKCGNANPSIATIAWHLGIDESLVCRGIRMLEDADVLSHDRQFNAASKYHIACKRTDTQVTPFDPKARAKLIADGGKAPDLDGAKGLTHDECLTTNLDTEREEIYLV